jgi:hypothetical protein
VVDRGSKKRSEAVCVAEEARRASTSKVLGFLFGVSHGLCLHVNAFVERQVAPGNLKQAAATCRQRWSGSL